MTFALEQARNRLRGKLPKDVREDLQEVVTSMENKQRELDKWFQKASAAAYALCNHEWVYVGEERNDQSVWCCSLCRADRSARVWDPAWGPAPK